MQRLKEELLPSVVLHLIIHLIPLTMVSWLILAIGGSNDILKIILGGLLLTVLILLAEIFGGLTLVISLFNIRWISHENDPLVYTMVKGLANKNEVNIAKIGIIELDEPNAFVVSSFRGPPILLFTRGLIYCLTFSELQAITLYMLGYAQHELLPIVTMLSGLQSVGSRLSMEYIESNVKKRNAGIFKTVLAGWGYLLFSAFNTQTIISGKLMIHEAETKTYELMDNPTAMITGLIKISFLLDTQQESYMRTGLISLKALMFQDPSIAVRDRVKLREILNHYNIKIEKLINNTPIKAVKNTEIKLHIFEKYLIHEGIEKRIKKIIEASMKNDSTVIFGFN